MSDYLHLTIRKKTLSLKLLTIIWMKNLANEEEEPFFSQATHIQTSFPYKCNFQLLFQICSFPS